ncbi:MAG TPA: isoprenylcysteine carboxylmethyltransferase family protein [Candidatus Limnocylindria bacterium]
MTLDDWEAAARRSGALVALAVGALLAPGVAASARDEGRVVGRPILGPVRLAILAAGWFGVAALLWRPLPIRLSPAQRRIALLVAVPTYVAGMVAVVTGRLALGRSYRVSSTVGLRLAPGHVLVQSGPYGIVRHPMYVGLFLAAAGTLLLYRTWATALFVAELPALVARARVEDRALAAEFGPAWAEYRDRVPTWFPRLRT